MLLGLTAVVIGYFLGSIPLAYIIARLRKGIDIRNCGVGNVGAVNIFRHVGNWEGFIVAFTDIAKGAVAILIAQALDVSQIWLLGAGFSAILGHNFPIFIGFKGGKGSATVIGIFLMLVPIEIGITLGIIAILILIFRNMAFAVCIGFVFMPILIWLLEGSIVLVFYSLAILMFIGVRSLPHAKQAWPKTRKNKNAIK